MWIATLAEFNEQLHLAGIDTIIADKQAQYDAWRQAQE